jgi:hypothetical protein
MVPGAEIIRTQAKMKHFKTAISGSKTFQSSKKQRDQNEFLRLSPIMERQCLLADSCAARPCRNRGSHNGIALALFLV